MVAPREFEAAGPVRGGQDDVTVQAEVVRDGIADSRIVLDHEDCGHLVSHASCHTPTVEGDDVPRRNGMLTRPGPSQTRVTVSGWVSFPMRADGTLALRRVTMNWIPLRAIFGRDSFRPGQVASWLRVGPALDGPGYLRLRQQGVTHIVDLRGECCDDPDEMDGLGLRWRRLPIEEGEAPSARQLNDLMHWLEAEAEEVPAAALYLHGAAGRGRTTTVAAALLMHQDRSLSDALSMVTAVSPACEVSPVQRAFLEGLAGRLGCDTSSGDLSAAGDG